jgi:import inner membrane translocase subunit TIM54
VARRRRLGPERALLPQVCQGPPRARRPCSAGALTPHAQPILNAAAVEHEIIRGKRVGDVAERISDAIRAERRIGAGLDPPRASPVPLATNRTPQERAARALAGGTVVVGRSTLKEYLAGLKSGWTDSLAKVDRDATLADALADDGTFDEPDEPALVGPDGEPLPTPVRPPAPGTTGPIFSPLQAQIRALESAAPAPPTAAAPQAIPAALDAPPAVLPALPPLLLVPHTNRIGLRHIPMMIWEWFNERERVLAGAQAGVALVRGATRPFSAPPPDVLAARDAAAAAAKAAASASEGDMADMADAPAPPAPGPDDATDLDFDRTGERVYKPSLSSWHADLEKARAEFYKKLPERLATARALARGTREASKDEVSHPPPTEHELREERLKNERRWRADAIGWDVVRPDAEPVWDERFRDVLRVFVDPGEGVDE